MPHITIARTPQEMVALRPLWESLCRRGRTTIFQDFQWSLLAAKMFVGREEPWVICARASYGVAIIPAVVRHQDASLRLVGEELFDYRTFLHEGDREVLAFALAELARLARPLEVVAIRECDRHAFFDRLSLVRFSAAPQILRANVSSEQFAARHGRLARNLRRLQRLGFVLNTYTGDNQSLLRSIYEGKAAQDSRSLFHDQLRIDFLVQAAQLDPNAVEIFTLESGPRMGAAVVTLRDGNVRRFYTGWFDPGLEKYSPAISLIYEVTRQSLQGGLDCDFMTGEQPYKMRLATASVPLYRLLATPQQLAALGHRSSTSLVG